MAAGIWQGSEHFSLHTSCQAGKSLLKTLQASPESAGKLQGPHEAQFDRWVSAGGVDQKLAASGSYQSKYYFGYSVVDEFGRIGACPACFASSFRVITFFYLYKSSIWSLIRPQLAQAKRRGGRLVWTCSKLMRMHAHLPILTLVFDLAVLCRRISSKKKFLPKATCCMYRFRYNWSL